MALLQLPIKTQGSSCIGDMQIIIIALLEFFKKKIILWVNLILIMLGF